MPDRSGPLRILHAPADVGGHAAGLAHAERRLGLRSEIAVFTPGPYGYDADFRFDLAGEPAWRRLAVRTGFLLRALRNYDVIHFNFGQSLIAFRAMGHVLNELPLIRRAGITIIVTFQGCDVRPQSACHCTREQCRVETPYRAPNAARFLRYADRAFHLNPDLRQWLPGSRFLAYAATDVDAVTPGPVTARSDGGLRVAHAPSNREVKGTDAVVAAVERLQADGLAIELDLIEGVDRRQAIERLRAADVVVDQLRLGWYGGVAVESMALAKPVLCHIDERTPEDNPFGAELPIVRATADTLGDRLRELAADADLRARIGSASREFAVRRHHPALVAREVLAGLAELPPAEDEQAG
jgi:glycosyltransferase involved in cell wall biosynthesis